MGFQNPPVPWRRIEETLSGKGEGLGGPANGTREPDGRGSAKAGGAKARGGGRELKQPPEAEAWGPGANGGDSPAWSYVRPSYRAPVFERRPSATPYAELHCHSTFSFLDGASQPEELAEEAARLDLKALAVTDHDGFYGIVRFTEAARAVGLPTVFGAELTIDKLDVSPGQPDPDGSHLLVLARDPVGYAALARVISEAQLAGSKGAPRMAMSDLDRWVTDAELGHWLILTGCRKGLVPRALEREGPAAAERALATLVDRFGATNVAVELWDHGAPLDSARNDALARLAVGAGLDVVATNNVHYASPSRRRLATAMAAVRARRSLDEIEGWLPPAASAHLRSGDEQARRFARYPGVVERAAELGLACAFDLSLMAPNLPPFPCPDGLSEMGYLRRLVEEGGVRRYGPRSSNDEFTVKAWAQLDSELDLIEHLGFPGYFLVVWDIVEFCRRNDILCQGRGSAANSAVCYVLGVTKADAVKLGLLFERFLSPERDGPPDIDLDIESDRREEAIQYVYKRHGRRHAAQVANVISYRRRSAIRDAAKALGYSPGQQDRFSKTIDGWGWGGRSSIAPAPKGEKAVNDDELPTDVVELAVEFETLPRHLGIHSGGMVMCDRPVIEVCPVEWGRMENRTVLQWDKDDCAAAGLVKFDLLGLGMLSALHYTTDLVAEHHGVEIDLADLDQSDAVYRMLCRADSVGVFQVESRAQMGTLPRLKPRTFYDLVVEIALIRPGPIQGGSVHPYIRRRNGLEPVTYLHPLLENALEKTLGVPLFQEQLMQITIDVAGFSAGDADELRQALGAKRSRRRMEQLRERFEIGAAERGVPTETIGKIWNKLAAFANYGFPESHSISFAYLVYASSWLKLHYPAAFCAGLLRAQPMGFYSPQSLTQDARRHGVPTYGPCVNTSLAEASLQELLPGDEPPRVIVAGGTLTAAETEAAAAEILAERRDHGWAVRLGLDSVRHVGDELAERIAAARAADGPFTSIEDVARRADVGQKALEALATAGALPSDNSSGKIRASAASGAGRTERGAGRRQALWEAGAIAQTGPGQLEGIVTGTTAPQLPGMGEHEEALADLWATGVTSQHPTGFLRQDLADRGATLACDLTKLDHGAKVVVGGVVTHRQRPATASGTTFLGLEDETGLINVVVSVGCWTRYRRAARGSPALLVKGRLERHDAAVNIVAEKLEPLDVGRVPRSRDFR
ncbi:MAG: error-prone DNA polymerase [Acidimicrobiia bacterium]|nr:error-prone DNA polymerase [Acidimicrobiia bacterium]